MAFPDKHPPTTMSRRNVGRLLGATAAASLLGGTGRAAAASPAAADLVFHNGDVITMDPKRPRATAVAVRAGRIVYVGPDAGARAFAGRGTETVDLRGRTLTPGINDTHLHAAVYRLNLPPYALDLGPAAAKSVTDIVAAVAAEAARTPAGEWIRGSGWNPRRLAENREPNRDDLDRVSPDHPVFLQDSGYHVSAVNSRALEIAGITDVGPDGSRKPGVDYDASGRPTGVLRYGGQALVQLLLPPRTREQRKQAIQDALTRLRAEGITSFTDPGLGPGGDGLGGGTQGIETLNAYVDLARAGTLDARVSALFLPCSQSGGSAAAVDKALREFAPPTGTDPRRFAVRGVKLFSDSGGDLLVAGDTHEERVAELTEMVRIAHAAGYQVAVHCYRWVPTVVDAFTATLSRHPRADARHIAMHGAFVPESLLPTMAEHRIGLGPQAQSWANAIHQAAQGPAGETFLPWRSAVDAGVPLLGSSDAPVNTPNWRAGVQALITRRGTCGHVHGPEQRLTLEQALATYTTTAAWQDHAENWKGSVSIGKAADLCVLGANLRTTPPDDISGIPVAMTVFDGHIVYTA
ncbi:amidohydrolase [Streptomyces albireticuli]|nr:amidohydrolase [Streptomyces albireticuli]MCD9144870.1 amidohydrolase [Streptomyces albireticuli]MCD9164296.1 amidohydrolase [Streptomyces albireticuli]MCD9194007.1 amidohydrolase [Streptomyces albireticuli]